MSNNFSTEIHHGMQDADKPIVYEFSTGTDVNRDLHVIDMTGKRRKFRIHINDEKGITECKKV